VLTVLLVVMAQLAPGTLLNPGAAESPPGTGCQIGTSGCFPSAPPGPVTPAADPGLTSEGALQQTLEEAQIAQVARQEEELARRQEHDRRMEELQQQQNQLLEQQINEQREQAAAQERRDEEARREQEALQNEQAAPRPSPAP
jgi:hypothetical protein